MRTPRTIHRHLALGLLAGSLALTHVSQGGDIRVIDILDQADSLAFTFSSTCRPGTSYQPQFLVDPATGTWSDIPDAAVSPVENEPGLFAVTAPKFGGDSGLYRVMSTASAESDPLASDLAEPDPEEILLLWNTTAFNDSSVRAQLHYHVESPPGGPQDNQLYTYPKTNPDDGFDSESTPFTFDSSLDTADHGATDSLVIDLDGDRRLDPLYAWVDRSNTLQLVLAGISNDDFSWSEVHRFPVPGAVVRSDATPPPVIRLVSAQLDGDPLPEVVLAYSGEDNFLHIQVLDFGGDLDTLAFGASASDTVLPFVDDGSFQDRSGTFDIVAADFDGDGLDELALATVEATDIPGGRQTWELYAKFYDYDPDAALSNRLVMDTIDRPSAVLFAQDDRDSLYLGRIAITAADFTGDGTPEVAVNYHIDTTGTTRYWYLQLLKPSPDFDSIELDTTKVNRHENSSGSGGYPISVLPFQLDDDPAYEILTAGRSISIFDPAPDLSVTRLGGGYGPATVSGDNSRRFVALAQLDTSDPNFGHLPEVVVSYLNSASPQFYEVATYKFTGDGSPGSPVNLVRDAELDLMNIGSNAHIALAVGDFGGNGVKLGSPRRYTRTVVDDPIVILNAPPVHYDILGGQEFDVNVNGGMFPLDCSRDGNSGLLLCPFHSRYTRTTTESATVSTTYTSSWAVGATVEGGFTIPIIDVGVGVEVETKYSESITDFESSSSTVTVELQATASADDSVYAATVDYTIWEYPILVDDVIVSHAIFVQPAVRANTWIGSKSPNLEGYRPTHEPGNLLSYSESTRPGAEFVRTISADRFEITTSSAFLWSLTKSTTETTTSTKTTAFEIGAEASFDIPIPFIPNFSVTGDYSTETIASRSTEVTDEQGIRVALAETNPSIAGTNYFVTPYMYWNRAGSLVLDYAVELPAGTPSVPTFWGQRYGERPDPAFILAQRLDPEKGFSLIVDKLRTQTRHIAVDEPEPRPGQTVNIKAQINNFSLLNLGSSFRVEFYLGDPDDGGTFIGEVVHGTGIPARGSVTVTQPWTIPSGITATSVEIHALIDPSDQVEEIHEDNNRAWAQVFLRNSP